MNLVRSTGTAAGHSRAAEHAAWVFYAIAALGSTIGQIWVGVDTPPWPAQLDWWWRAAMVAPFAAVIDLGGVVTSAFADARQRLGESAYGWRILSAGSVTTGVGINVLGHADVPYLAVVFGCLGVFAYTVWLLHAAARRATRYAPRASWPTPPPSTDSLSGDANPPSPTAPDPSPWPTATACTNPSTSPERSYATSSAAPPWPNTSRP
jgi:hypothetical protein